MLEGQQGALREGVWQSVSGKVPEGVKNRTQKDVERRMQRNTQEMGLETAQAALERASSEGRNLGARGGAEASDTCHYD